MAMFNVFVNKFVEVQINANQRLIGQCKSISKVKDGFRVVIGNQSLVVNNLGNLSFI